MNVPDVSTRLCFDSRAATAAVAAMAAAAAELIYISALPAGVFHSEQVFELVPAGGQLRLRASARTGIAEVPILARKLRLAALLH